MTELSRHKDYSLMARSHLESMSGDTTDFFKDSVAITCMHSSEKLREFIRDLLSTCAQLSGHWNGVSKRNANFIISVLTNTGLTDEALDNLCRDHLVQIFYYYTKLNYFVTRTMTSGMTADQFFAPLIVIREHIINATP